MQKVLKGDWEQHRPATNTMWVHYLTDIILTQKTASFSAEDKRELREMRGFK